MSQYEDDADLLSEECANCGELRGACDCVEPAESDRIDLKQVANMLYDLFRSAPISATINGEGGRAAFYDRDAQRAQALIILTKIWQAARATPSPEPPRQIGELQEDFSTLYENASIALKHLQVFDKVGEPNTLTALAVKAGKFYKEILAPSSHSEPELVKLREALKIALFPLATLVLSGECTTAESALNEELKQQIVEAHDVILAALASTPQNELGK